MFAVIFRTEKVGQSQGEISSLYHSKEQKKGVKRERTTCIFLLLYYKL